MSTPVRVTATLDTPVSGVLSHPFMLDGPLAWAYFASSPERQPYLPVDIDPDDAPLPLATWHMYGTWGWCTSQAVYEISGYTQTEIRRPPSDLAFARYTTEKKHHHGLGPMKARDSIIPLTIIKTMAWDVASTDPDALADLCTRITHLGGHRTIGCGHVTRWEFETGTPGAWENRPMPEPGVTGTFRAPYHHPMRRVTISAEAI